MKNKTIKIFGIGAAVLFVLMAFTPVCSADVIEEPPPEREPTKEEPKKSSNVREMNPSERRKVEQVILIISKFNKKAAEDLQKFHFKVAPIMEAGMVYMLGMQDGPLVVFKQSIFKTATPEQFVLGLLHEYSHYLDDIDGTPIPPSKPDGIIRAQTEIKAYAYTIEQAILLKEYYESILNNQNLPLENKKFLKDRIKHVERLIVKFEGHIARLKELIGKAVDDSQSNTRTSEMEVPGGTWVTITTFELSTFSCFIPDHKGVGMEPIY